MFNCVQIRISSNIEIRMCLFVCSKKIINTNEFDKYLNPLNLLLQYYIVIFSEISPQRIR